MGLNRWTGQGNLTRDGEMKYIPSGKSLLKFSIAVNERYKDAQGQWQDGKTLFMDVTAWEWLAEKWASAAVKGASFHVEGKLVLEEWDDKESGVKRSKITCTATDIHPMVRAPKKDGGDESGGREESGGRRQAGGREPPPQRGATATRSAPAQRGGGGGFSAEL